MSATELLTLGGVFAHFIFACCRPVPKCAGEKKRRGAVFVPVTPAAPVMPQYQIPIAGPEITRPLDSPEVLVKG